MADKKISALTASTTPLAGTEVLPIVQSGSTVKVAVSNLTAGRDVSMKRGTSTDGFYVSGVGKVLYFDTTGEAQSNQIATVNDFNLQMSCGRGSTSSVTAASDSIRLSVGGVEQFRVNTTGNLAVLNAGKGIDFSANTHAAGMTSELLNDYEEGTWTPTIIGATSAGTGTYSTQTGTYTKVGRLVSVQIVLTWTAHTGTGAMKVAGLPFTVSASVANPIAIAAYDMVNPASTILGGVVNLSATTIELLSLPVGGGAWSGVAMDTDVPALVISGQYFV